MCNDDNAGPPITADLERPSVCLSSLSLVRSRRSSLSLSLCRCSDLGLYDVLFKEATHIPGPLILSLELRCLKTVEASLGT